MTYPIAINGLGRIGRALLRVAARRPEIAVVAVNDRAPAATLARLLRHDTVHGRYPGLVEADDDCLRVDGSEIRVFTEPTAASIPWGETPTRIVVEATGAATSRAAAAAHLGGSVDKVLISAPAADADLTVCCGLNLDAYDATRHHVVSNASCTTNCLALLLVVIDELCGVEQAMMNEVHSYTADQSLVDGIHDDPRRGRSAAVNIVPTYSGAPAAAERLLPRLAGRLAGGAVRVPTPDVALLDLVFTTARPVRAAGLAEAFRAAADGPLRGLLAVTDEPLVSSDVIGDTHSAIVDLERLEARGNLCRVQAWYDNEWGYANRLADVLKRMGESFG